MNPMSPEQRAELRDVLVGANPAAPELVRDAVADAHGARWTSGLQSERARQRAADAVLAIARRLLDVETELATLREVIARLVVGNDHGDDSSLSDLAHELKTRGIDLGPEYESASALARAGALDSVQWPEQIPAVAR